LSLSRENPEPYFSAALGLAATLGLAFFGVRTSCIAVVKKTPQHSITATLGLAEALGFLLRVGMLFCVFGGDS
jgi:hypothetical protein